MTLRKYKGSEKAAKLMRLDTAGNAAAMLPFTPLGNIRSDILVIIIDIYKIAKRLSAPPSFSRAARHRKQEVLGRISPPLVFHHKLSI
jgi:hypothetical protein